MGMSIHSCVGVIYDYVNGYALVLCSNTISGMNTLLSWCHMRLCGWACSCVGVIYDYVDGYALVLVSYTMSGLGVLSYCVQIRCLAWVRC